MLKKIFVNSYLEARKEFKKETKNLKQSSYNVVDNLTVDVAEHHPKKKDTLLIIQSGVHGVEGYVGSFFQLYFMKNYFNKIKKKMGVLLIHSLNPYGYYHNRRVNENNVDLNRNFIDVFDHEEFVNKRVASCMRNSCSFIAPKRQRKYPLVEIVFFWFKLIYTTIKYGLNNAVKAGSFGQTKWSKCVCFAGKKKEMSNKIFTEIIRNSTKGYKRAILVDIHSGTAKKFHYRGFTSTPGNTEGFQLLKGIFYDLQKDGRQGMGIDIRGSAAPYFHKISKAKENVDVSIEFGTILKYSTLLSIQYLSHLLVKENQVTHQGPKYKIPKYRKLMKRAYFPDSRKYRKFLIKSSRKILDRLLLKLEESKR